MGHAVGLRAPWKRVAVRGALAILVDAVLSTEERSPLSVRILAIWVPVVVLAASACDGDIVVEGQVSDAATEEPVADAEVYLGDQEFDDFDRYFATRDADALIKAFEVDEDGSYLASELLAGNGKHDVSMVVVADGYADHVQRVWKGKGMPENDHRIINVDLELSE